MITHLFFADDSLLFYKASRQECQKLTEILELYEVALGQKINADKSSVCFSHNAPSGLKNEVLEILGPMQDQRHRKYLGLPSIISKSKKKIFAEVKEKVGKKFSGWKEKFLLGGRTEVLIKAVAQAISTYTMSCFQLPKGLCDEIEGIMRRFWWGQRQKESKIAWVNWKTMCKSKLRGGMGFRNLQAFNLAMLAKQRWRLLSNPHSLVTRIYKAKYYLHGDVLNSQLGSNPSYAWRSIFNSLEVIKRGTRWKVGNGKVIHICEDKWLPTPSTYTIISPPRILIDSESRRWKVD